MDKWDVSSSKPRLKGGNIPLCDLSPRHALHQLGGLVYLSMYRRTKKGLPFGEIKRSEEYADQFAGSAVSLILRLVNNTEDWAIVTTPKRRHHDGFHFASAVCGIIADKLNIPFYADAVQCINRRRLDPEFHLLRPIVESNVIVFDDIITTGSTLTATWELLRDKRIVLNIIGINNR